MKTPPTAGVQAGVPVGVQAGVDRPTRGVAAHNGCIDPYFASPARQWWLVFALTVAATLGGIDRQIISLLLNPIKLDLSLSDTQLSLIYGGAFAVTNILFMLPAGYLADRLSRRSLLAAGVLAWSMMSLACGAASNYLQLFAARAGVGLGEAVIQPAAVSMLRSAIAPEWRGRAYSVFSMAIMFGSALALIVGGALVKLILSSGIHELPILGAVRPWQLVLMLIGMAGVPVFLLLLTVTEPSRASAAHAPRTGAEHTARTVGYASVLAYLKNNWSVYLPLLLYNAGAGMVTLSYGAWIAPLLTRVWRLSIPQIGATLGLLMLVLPPLGSLCIGMAMDRMARRRGVRGLVLVGIGAITVLGTVSALCPLAPTITLFWALMAGTMLVSGCCFPITNTIVAAISPPHMIGKIAAIQYCIYGLLGAAVGPTLVAAVSDRYFQGPRAIAMALGLVTGAYSLVSLGCMLVVGRTVRNPLRQLASPA